MMHIRSSCGTRYAGLSHLRKRGQKVVRQVQPPGHLRLRVCRSFLPGGRGSPALCLVCGAPPRAPFPERTHLCQPRRVREVHPDAHAHTGHGSGLMRSWRLCHGTASPTASVENQPRHPLAGDVQSRQRMWETVSAGLGGHSACVLSSHPKRSTNGVS